jgi:transposase
MRGIDTKQARLFSYVSQEERIPQSHPLRTIRRMSDAVLESLTKRFDRLYSDTGRPSIPPERLLRALLLQVLYSIRSERLLMEQLDYNLLYRWFVGLNMDDEVWDASVYTKNRDRLLEGDIADVFFDQVMAIARERALLSDEHFTVDGTLIEAWAGQKSFQKKEGSSQPPSDGGSNPTVDFHGEKRSNATHESTTDPEARLAKKSPGVGAQLCHSGHVLMENRHGLCLDIAVAAADGYAERNTATKLLRRFERRHGVKPKTMGGDGGFAAGEFLRRIEEDLHITPHVPLSAERVTSRGAAADARRRMRRRMKTKGYALSQRARKKIEQMFGWMKQAGGLRKARHVGRWKIQQVAYLWAAAYNLLRLAHLEQWEAVG